jgi:co-chaperonin GroES (HSP10)
MTSKLKRKTPATATRADKLDAFLEYRVKVFKRALEGTSITKLVRARTAAVAAETAAGKSLDQTHLADFRAKIKTLIAQTPDGAKEFAAARAESTADVGGVTHDTKELAQALHHERRAAYLKGRVGERQDHRDAAKRQKTDAPVPLSQDDDEDEGEIIARLTETVEGHRAYNDQLLARLYDAEVAKAEAEAEKAEVRRAVTMEVHTAIRDEYLRLGGNKVVLINAFAAAGKITHADTFVQSAVTAAAASPEWYNPIHTPCSGTWLESYTAMNAKLVLKYQEQRDRNETKGKGCKDYDTASRALVKLGFVQAGDQVLFQYGGGKRRKRNSELFVVEMVKDVMAKLSGRKGEVAVSALYVKHSREPLVVPVSASRIVDKTHAVTLLPRELSSIVSGYCMDPATASPVARASPVSP